MNLPRNSLGRKWPKPDKKPVTLIVGIVCRGAIVLAADGQTTKLNSKQLGVNKISLVDFQDGVAAVAESGSASLSNAAIQIFKNLSRDKRAENELTIAKFAEQAVRQVISGITAHLNPNSPDRERQEFLFEPQNYFELMVAYYFNRNPYIYTLKSAWCIPIPATSYFETSGIAGDLATYILKEHTIPKMDKDLASVIAIKTVKDAIDNVEGCGLPIRVAMIHRPQRVRPFKLVAKQNSHIGERVYGQEETHASWIKIFEPERVEGVTRIISKVENQLQNARNKKFHKALQDQNRAYSKLLDKEWDAFCRKHPKEAAEAEERILNGGHSFEVIPDGD